MSEDVERGLSSHPLLGLAGGSSSSSDSSSDDEETVAASLPRAVASQRSVSAVVAHSAPAPNVVIDPRLKQAIYRNSPHLVRRLLSDDPDTTAVAGRRSNALHLVIRLKHEDCLQALLLGHTDMVNTCDKQGETPLHLSVRTGWPEGVRRLLAAGADVTSKTNRGETVLNLAVATAKKSSGKWLKGPPLAAVEEVVEEVLGAIGLLGNSEEIINSPDNEGNLPLFTAISSGNVKIMKSFLNAGADIFLKDDRHRTVIHLAAQMQQSKILSRLIHHAKFERKVGQEVWQHFLEEVVDMKHSASKSVLVGTALHVAVNEGNSECVRILLRQGCDIMKLCSFNGEQNYTVFHLAAMQKEEDVMYPLVKHLAKLKEAKSKLVNEKFASIVNKAIHLEENIFTVVDNMDKDNISSSDIDKYDNVQKELESNIKANIEVDEKLIFANASKLDGDEAQYFHKTAPNMKRKSRTVPRLAWIWHLERISEETFGVKDKRSTIVNNQATTLELLQKKSDLLDQQFRILVQKSELFNDPLQETLNKNKMHFIALMSKDDITTVEMNKIDKQCRCLNEKTEKGLSPLLIACKNNTGSREVVKLLIQEGADLTETCADIDGKKITLMDLVIHCLPSSVEMFKDILDSGIELKKEYVEVDYKILSPDEDEKNNLNVLNAFLKTGDKLGQRTLLEHPLIQSFLQLQWEKLKIFYYILIFVFFVLIASLNSLLFARFVFETDPNSTETWIACSKTFIIISVIFLLLYSELYYVYLITGLSWRKRILLIYNIICLVITIIVVFADLPREWAVIAVVLAWLQFMYLVSRIPRYGQYILIFIEVTANSMNALLHFACIFIQFMYIGMVLFYVQPPFDSLSNSLMKTVVMMVGELDYVSVFANYKNNNVYSLFFVKLTFVMFILLVGMVIVNLLIAKALIHMSQVDRLRKQAEALCIYEDIFCTKTKWNYFSRFIHKLVISFVDLMNNIKKSLKIWLYVCYNGICSKLGRNIDPTTSKASPREESFFERWKENRRVVFKLQLSITGSRNRNVSVENKVINIILNQGYVNAQIKEERRKEQQRKKDERKAKTDKENRRKEKLNVKIENVHLKQEILKERADKLQIEEQVQKLQIENSYLREKLMNDIVEKFEGFCTALRSDIHVLKENCIAGSIPCQPQYLQDDTED